MNTDPFLAFDALTVEGISVLKELQEILEKELTALSERKIDPLADFNTQKQTLLIAFEKNISTRNELLKTLSYDSSKEGVTMFLASCEIIRLKQQATDNWASLENQLKLTMVANSTNEQVLSRNQKNISEVLSILQGKNAKNVLYTAKGNKGDYSGQSRLGKA